MVGIRALTKTQPQPPPQVKWTLDVKNYKEQKTKKEKRKEETLFPELNYIYVTYPRRDC